MKQEFKEMRIQHPEHGKWVVTMDKNNKPCRWDPLPEYLARKFVSTVFDRTVFSPLMFWGEKITDKEKIYNIAKSIYEENEEFKDLPISYLEYYKP